MDGHGGGATITKNEWDKKSFDLTGKLLGRLFFITADNFVALYIGRGISRGNFHRLHGRQRGMKNPNTGQEHEPHFHCTKRSPHTIFHGQQRGFELFAVFEAKSPFQPSPLDSPLRMAKTPSQTTVTPQNVQWKTIISTIYISNVIGGLGYPDSSQGGDLGGTRVSSTARRPLRNCCKA